MARAAIARVHVVKKTLTTCMRQAGKGERPDAGRSPGCSAVSDMGADTDIPATLGYRGGLAKSPATGASRGADAPRRGLISRGAMPIVLRMCSVVRSLADGCCR